MSQAGIINISGSGTTVVSTLTGNSGGAVSPTANNIDTVGVGSITIVGDTGTSTLTTQLTGLTDHNILIGAGTTTITNLAPSSTSGVPLVSQGSSADPSFSTAVVAGGGTGSTSFNINGIVVSNTTTDGALSSITLTNGQLAIGSTSASPVAATLTAGTGVSITNSAGSIVINSTGGGFSWTDVTGTSQLMAVNNGYTANNASLVTLTLPTTAVYGSLLAVIGKGAGGWKVAQNASQQIVFGSSSTTSGIGGSLASTNAHDVVHIFCSTANTGFTVTNSIGNLTVV